MRFLNGLHFAEEQFKNFMAGFKYVHLNDNRPLNIGVLCGAGLDTSVLLDIVNKYKLTFGYNVTILYISFLDFENGKIADTLMMRKAEMYGNHLVSEICNINKFEPKFVSAVSGVLGKIISETPDLDLILSADTIDDELETFLLNVLRGCEVHNLQGLDFVSPVNSKFGKRFIGRPFITTKKAILVDYSRSTSISYIIDDCSYTTTDSDRSYIANNLIPLIQHKFSMESFLRTISGIRKHITKSKEVSTKFDIKSGDWSVDDFLNLPIGNRMFLIREHFKSVHDIELSQPLLLSLRAKIEEDIFDLCVVIEEKFILVKEDGRIRVNQKKEVTTVA